MAPSRRTVLTGMAGLAMMPLPAWAADREALLHMRNEEKLARDLYRRLGQRWQLSIFDHIAESEQRHMDAVLSLLEQAGIEDPVAGLGTGELADAELQHLHDELLEKGLRSRADALEVGCIVEDVDLADLERVAQGDPVLERLRCASGNHLRAFVAQLEGVGRTYQPQYLSPSRYQAVLAEPSGPCGRGRGRRHQEFR